MVYCSFFLLLFSAVAQATWLDPREIQVNATTQNARASTVTEQDFRSVIDKAQNIYAPIAKLHGGSLSIQGDWRSEQLNAGASRMSGKWMVKISGALARRPELSLDGFTLILCHELGHHFAGFAFAPSQVPIQKAWAANEGQSDYYSTQVCARKMWGGELEQNRKFRETSSFAIKSLCDSEWVNLEDQDLCYRTLNAVESMTDLMAALTNKPKPSFETPDQTKVEKTLHSHPQIQCRMDTTAQAALCKAYFTDNLIPGLRARQGLDSAEAEQEASRYSCSAYTGHTVGLRPGCWFKTKL